MLAKVLLGDQRGGKVPDLLVWGAMEFECRDHQELWCGLGVLAHYQGQLVGWGDHEAGAGVCEIGMGSLAMEPWGWFHWHGWDECTEVAEGWWGYQKCGWC